MGNRAAEDAEMPPVVVGSVIDSTGETFLIARELKTGKNVVKLRDEHGVPAWAGGRRP
jgi:hypothetical protein